MSETENTENTENTEIATEATGAAIDEVDSLPAIPNKERAARKAADKVPPAEEPAGESDESDESGEPAVDSVEAEQDEDRELDTAVWGDPGNDEVARSTLTLIQNSGLTPERARELFESAREKLDPSMVDRDKLVEAVGKTKATLIMAGFESVVARERARVAEVTKIAHEVAGNESNWAKAAKWATANIPADELAELRDMLDKGGKQARFAAKDIVDRYNADPKNTALTAGTGQIKPDAKAGAATKGISRREYGEKLEQLYRRGASEAEFAALRAQREIGKKQGL